MRGNPNLRSSPRRKQRGALVFRELSLARGEVVSYDRLIAVANLEHLGWERGRSALGNIIFRLRRSEMVKHNFTILVQQNQGYKLARSW